MVSIFCLTYNHEKFIRDALDGFLMQNTTFPVEIFVHDDASTDSTQKILQEYKQKYSNLFRLFLQKENQWQKNNKKIIFELYEKQRGEFIALCEGDDYWTSPEKLEVQIDILKKEKTTALVFHDAVIKYEKNEEDFYLNKQLDKRRFTLGEVISRDWFMSSASIVFRKNPLVLPELWNYVISGDMLLQISACLHGEAVFLDKKMSVYRRHSAGVSNEFWKSGRELYEILRPNHIWMLWYFQKICKNNKDIRIKTIKRTKALLENILHFKMAQETDSFLKLFKIRTEMRELLSSASPTKDSEHFKDLLRLGDKVVFKTWFRYHLSKIKRIIKKRFFK